MHSWHTRRTTRTQSTYLYPKADNANICFPWYAAPCPYVFPNIDTHFNTVYQPFILLALKRWFSNFEDHVLALGGMIKPWDTSLHFSGLVCGDPAYIQPEARCLPKHPNIPNDGKVPHSLYLSRVRFEPLLRRLVKQRYPDVIFIKGTVASVVLDAMKKRVTGIEYTSEKGERVSLECSLFVDCTGMARMGVKWLQKAGVSPPRVITYNANIRYGFSEYFSRFPCFKKSATSITPLVYLPIPPSVKYRLPIPGGIKDCQPVFYTNYPQSIYDWRAIYGVKVEDDTSQSPFFGLISPFICLTKLFRSQWLLLSGAGACQPKGCRALQRKSKPT